MSEQNRRMRALAGAGWLMVTSAVMAQTTPDAGQILQQQPKPPAQVVTPQTVLPDTPTVAPEQDAGPKVLVKGFRIKGALLIPEAELQARIADVIGKQLSLGQLKGLTLYLAGYYIEQGYLARVVLPPQDIKDGIVDIQVVEGKRGSVRVDSQDPRLDSARVQAFIEQRLAQGGALDITALGEAVNILNEQPGTNAKVALAAGKGEGEIDLNISASSTPLVSGNLGLNNQGSRGTGEVQGSAGLTLNNPTGHFDALSLLANLSEGNTYGRIDYSLAVGDRGLRLGINGSTLHYQLTQASFVALEGRGTAHTAGLVASYPLARRNDLSLSLSGGYDDKRLTDRTIAGETSRRHVTVTSLAIDGYAQHRFGVTSVGVSLSVGHSDQRNASALALDQASRRTQGSFNKLGYTLSQLVPVSARWVVSGSLRGQVAGNNLDSTERMGLGGPNAIRAYPVGEATGDEAWLLNLNLGFKVDDALAATAFFDTGSVTLNKYTWVGWNAANPQLPNRYRLSGLGVSVDWRLRPALLLSASVAAPLGNNPGRDANDRNADGRPQHRARGWISLSARI